MGKIRKIREQKKIEAQMQEELKKKKNKKTMLIIGIVIIVLIIAVVAIFYFISLNKSSKIIKVAMQTEKGSIELELYKEAAPNTVDNFVKLAEQGFYDGMIFHRVIEDFMIQSGDPGTGGPGYTFDDEINPKALGLSDELIVQLQNQGYKFNFLLDSIRHKVGTISMANSGPNTNGSQFFIITIKDQPDLDGRYTAFGQVISGMDVVQEIEQGDIINKIIIN